MKKEAKRFESKTCRLVYKPKTGVAHIRAESLYEAKTFLLKHMDSKEIGIVHGIAVTLGMDPRVTVMIRGKNLFKFIQSELNERASYRTKKSFTAMAEEPKPKNLVELVVYCPGTRRFLVGQTLDRQRLGFPTSVILSYENHEGVAMKTLTMLTDTVVTKKHIKNINVVDMPDKSKHYVYLMIAKSEFPPNAAGKGMVWMRHEIENLNQVSEMLFKSDPTIGKILESENSLEKMDFSKLVEDMVD